MGVGEGGAFAGGKGLGSISIRSKEKGRGSGAGEVGGEGEDERSNPLLIIYFCTAAPLSASRKLKIFVATPCEPIVACPYATTEMDITNSSQHKDVFCPES